MTCFQTDSSKLKEFAHYSEFDENAKKICKE